MPLSSLRRNSSARLRSVLGRFDRVVPSRLRRPTTPAQTPGVYIEEVSSAARQIQSAETSVTAFVGRTSQGPTQQPTLVRGEGEFDKTFGASTEEGMLGRSVRAFFQNGGGEALVVRVTEGDAGASDSPVTAAVVEGDRAARTGLYALDHAEAFNLLCIPPFAPGLDVPRTTWDAAAAYCRERRAVLLVDPPRTWTVASAVTPQAISDLVTPDENAALYFPHLLVPDAGSVTGTVQLAPSGAIAGVIARTDRERGVWKAPAGMEASIRGVNGLSLVLSDDDNGPINQEGVNAIRDMPGVGLVVWGARTLRGSDRFASEWKYFPVRRTALFIEESIHNGTAWVVFEPNGEPLWTQLRASVEPFLASLFRSGALQGSTPRDAYFVKCDRTTTTQLDIAEGRVNVLVGFAPLKPAEFVVIRIELVTASE